ncbi:MAG: sugar phosphate nucleotidyltransferase [Actinomycetota bacterium]|nr:sugar phosphate nucleotidyltransferase [Actinomycetota bacterium]
MTPAGIVLAAGAGTRLRPLTTLRPKALCPVGNVPLVDLALGRVAAAGVTDVAVNAHHLADQLEAHLTGRVHLSVERPAALGTAGAVGALREWLDGRPALVCNSDAYLDGGLTGLMHGWDGERPRVLVVRDPGAADFGPWRFAGASLLPWTFAERLAPSPAGLYEAVWRDAEAHGQLELIEYPAVFIDCGTPPDYLAANLHAAGGASVIAPDAVVEGELDRCVIWPRAVVRRGERLVQCVRADGGLTVDCSRGSVS